MLMLVVIKKNIFHIYIINRLVIFKLSSGLMIVLHIFLSIPQLSFVIDFETISFDGDDNSTKGNSVVCKSLLENH
jgi:hypothetical protein